MLSQREGRSGIQGSLHTKMFSLDPTSLQAPLDSSGRALSILLYENEAELASFAWSQEFPTLYLACNTFTQKLSLPGKSYQANLAIIASLKLSNSLKPSLPSHRGLHNVDHTTGVNNFLPSFLGLHQNLTDASMSSHIFLGNLKAAIP